MFAIIISEKGGAERRESFDKTEINVGRVQGNDLMLPKGNVSKRHARLLYRDGRFIVTDLKSTNGTYVNGRKIAQATIVREGDKIYIGDFVLRIELSGEGQAAANADGAPPPPQEEPSAEEAADRAPAQTGQPFARPPAPPPLPGAPTAGPPPMPALQSSPNIPAAAPLPAAGPPNTGPQMGGPSPSVRPPEPPQMPAMGGPSLGAVAITPGAPQPPPMMAPSPINQAARETALGPGPRAPAPPPMMGQPMMAGGALQPPPAPVAPVPPQAPPMAPPMAPMNQGGLGLAPPPGFAGGPEVRPDIVQPPPIAPGFVPQPPPPVPVESHTPYGQPAPSAPPPGQSGLHAPPMPPNPVPSPSMQPAKVSAPPPPPIAPASIPASSQPAQSPRSSVRSAAASEGVVDSSQAAAHRSALMKLMERTSQATDLGSLASGDTPPPSIVATIERTLNDKANAMRSAGELPAGVDPDLLVAEARRELFELGPVGPLLEDEYVEEVQVIRHDHLVAMHGKKQVATEIAFTSEAAVARLVRRLCVRAGRPLAQGELFVDRRIERGARLFGVLPPASGDSHMLVLRKPQRALATLEELVKSGAIARQIATLLAQAVQGRANILVTGSVGAGATILLGALAGAGNLEDRVVVLQEDDELVLNQPHTVSMLLGDTAEEGARAVHAAIRVRPDRLVIGAFAGHVVPEIVDAIGDGVDGVLAAARAPTLRHLVARLPADIAATRRMMSLETAREWLAGSFDLVLEVARLRDGRNRVMRVAEFTLNEASPLELRDIFTFTVERTAAGGTVEGTFHPTGVVPRIAEDLVSRGVPLDHGIFKRTTR